MRFFAKAEAQYGDIHLKELHVEDVGAYREMVVGGHELVNFGFDSFLGLDQDPRVKAALIRGARQWGTQFGASRAFASCGIEVELERQILARWMGPKPPLFSRPSHSPTSVRCRGWSARQTSF